MGMTPQRMALALQVDAIERLLHQIFVESRTEVVADVFRPIQLNFFTEGNERVGVVMPQAA
jgi:hypothetical protein